jgi:SAM-dependent methyltransferase
MDNYEYCADYAERLAAGRAIRVLDYGCGAGQIVAALCRRSIDAFGCDIFYDGGSYESNVPAELRTSRILKMQDDAIPFPSEHFDLVINNQVLEHVPDLRGVVREMARVLKPGGIVLSLFPDKSIWFEGHCGLPFLHRLPPNSSFAVAYAFACRCAGLGYFTEGKSRFRWAVDFCDWLSKWTYYRSRTEIETCFGQVFEPPQFLEPDWIRRRFGNRIHFLAHLPDAMLRFVAHKRAGLVFQCRKRAIYATG